MFSLKPLDTNDTIPVTWTLEDGYIGQGGPLDPNAYPFNTIGGLFGKTFSFVLNVLKVNLISDCDGMQGFKVN